MKKFLSFILIAFLVLWPKVYAEIQQPVGDSSRADTFSGTPVIASITVNRPGALITILEGDSANTSVASSWTANGVAMTEATSCKAQVGGFNVRGYYFVATTTGTVNFSIGFSTAPSVAGIMMIAAVYGADLQNPIDNCATGSGTSATPSLSITTNFAGDMLLSNIMNGSACTIPTPTSPAVGYGNVTGGCTGSSSWADGQLTNAAKGSNSIAYGTANTTYTMNIMAIKPLLGSYIQLDAYTVINGQLSI